MACKAKVTERDSNWFDIAQYRSCLPSFLALSRRSIWCFRYLFNLRLRKAACHFVGSRRLYTSCLRNSGSYPETSTLNSEQLGSGFHGPHLYLLDLFSGSSFISGLGLELLSSSITWLNSFSQFFFISIDGFGRNLPFLQTGSAGRGPSWSWFITSDLDTWLLWVICFATLWIMWTGQGSSPGAVSLSIIIAGSPYFPCQVVIFSLLIRLTSSGSCPLHSGTCFPCESIEIFKVRLTFFFKVFCLPLGLYQVFLLEHINSFMGYFTMEYRPSNTPNGLRHIRFALHLWGSWSTIQEVLQGLGIWWKFTELKVARSQSPSCSLSTIFQNKNRLAVLLDLPELHNS